MECYVIDDEKDNLVICEKYLRKLGVVARTFQDPVDAFERCLKQLPDFIILDWHMPVMDGPEFMARLLQEAGTDMPPVIMCTCENQQESIVKVIRDGAMGYIVKPFSRSTLEMQLRQLGIIMSKNEDAELLFATEKTEVKKITF